MTGSPEHLASTEIRDSLIALKHRNNGWSLTLFSDDQQLDFISKHFSAKVKDCYLRINPRYGAARADLFRYLVIYAIGGVYFDIKSTCLIPLGAFLRNDDSLVIGQWDNQIDRPYEGYGLSPDVWDIAGGEYINWFFAAEPKNPILLDVIMYVLNQINTYQPKENNKGRNGILRVTGPIAWSRAIISSYRKHKNKTDYRLRIVNSADAALVYSIFDTQEISGNPTLHRSIFKDHYTNSDEPAVFGSSYSGV
jgi:inositol phosphorylceramide mannosyltransferase catalytic subunit